jgi:hypothetical protein
VNDPDSAGPPAELFYRELMLGSLICSVVLGFLDAYLAAPVARSGSPA